MLTRRIILARKTNMFIRRLLGIILALAGLLVIVKMVPGFLWPLLLGVIFIWLGWHIYSSDHYY